MKPHQEEIELINLETGEREKEKERERETKREREIMMHTQTHNN